VNTRSTLTFLLPMLAAGVFMSGCADNVPKAEMSKDVVSAYKIDADDQPTVNVATSPGVVATEDEKEHFKKVLTDKLNERRARNAANGDAKKCDVNVTVTKFDKGSKFARAMLAGLGQIHLDADVVVLPAGGGDKLDAFSMSKTFAWGGIYGASESIEDIENPFADGIAAALTGQSPEPEKAKAPAEKAKP
jgi:hypothetical protein